MESDAFKEIEKFMKKTGDFLKTKKGQSILIIFVVLAIIVLGTHIRVQNMNLLEDQTTGEKIPLALDPHYFLRVAETMSQPGPMPECDSLRVLPGECREWHPEILPHSSILINKIVSVFDGDFTLRHAHVINPVVFFALGLFVYFLLVSKLTKSRVMALISSLFLAITPLYLYRTMAGFADHESIGMFSFFLMLLVFSVSLKYLDKNMDKTNKKTTRNKYLYGILTGFLIALTIACWGGIANFSFMIIPLAVLIFWFVKRKSYSPEKGGLRKLSVIPLFYILTMLFAEIFTPLISGHEAGTVLTGQMLSSTGIISAFVLGFLIIDYLMIYLNKKKIFRINKKYELLTSFVVLAVLGIIFLAITGELSVLGEIFDKILNPFGTGRIGETVAENKSPTLNSWINQTGGIFFWIFLLGMGFAGKELSRKISRFKKRRNTFFLLFILMFIGIIFSSHSMFKGSEFFKMFIYFAPFIAFVGYSAWLYGKEESDSFKMETGWIIAFSWMIFMLIAARGAVRLFFVIAPFVTFMAGIVPVRLFSIARKSKDELVKTFTWIVLVAVIIGLISSGIGFYQSSLKQASQTGPSANEQWQYTMNWVRENTAENSTFLHWWDYGYWVETLGERRALADGGHFQGQKRTHMIGRYVLTTPNPATMFSFMKSNNATHLLIDSSDIGKYGAYSRIGSGEDMKDRLSYIQTFSMDPKQTKETRNGTIRIYRGGFGLDEDLIYTKENGQEILLPKQKAALGAIILETVQKGNKTEFKQPEGIFIYNQQQYRIPIRYLYIDGEIKDFGSGNNPNQSNMVNSVIKMIPSLSQSEQGTGIDELGGAMYLSRKVSQSTVAQLYLMDDPFDRYEGLELAHKQQDRIVQMLKMRGMPIGDFVNYRGLRGPIKIWKVKDMPEDIKVHEEFAQYDPYGDDWKFGMLDELKFRE